MKITHKEKFKTDLKDYYLMCIRLDNGSPYCSYGELEKELIKELQHRKKTM